MTGEVRLDGGNYGKMAFQAGPIHQNQATRRLRREKLQWWCNQDTINIDLKAIWEMSVNTTNRPEVRA